MAMICEACRRLEKRFSIHTHEMEYERSGTNVENEGGESSIEISNLRHVVQVLECDR